MAILQLRSNRKPTGGRYKKPKVRRLSRYGRQSVSTKLADTKLKTVKTIGGNKKTMLLRANKVNIFDEKTKKHKVAQIKTAMENPANRHYVRRNILTMGAIVDTEMGKVRITSRPGQEGTLNGILISE